jgi:hypothetical protein
LIVSSSEMVDWSDQKAQGLLSPIRSDRWARQVSTVGQKPSCEGSQAHRVKKSFEQGKSEGAPGESGSFTTTDCVVPFEWNAQARAALCYCYHCIVSFRKHIHEPRRASLLEEYPSAPVRPKVIRDSLFSLLFNLPEIRARAQNKIPETNIWRHPSTRALTE